MKRSITKQERIVEILYEFAENLQTKPHDCKSESFDGKHKCSVNLESVGKAHVEIMKTFGYGMIEVQ